jgi:hypothetical protein
LEFPISKAIFDIVTRVVMCVFREKIN